MAKQVSTALSCTTTPPAGTTAPPVEARAGGGGPLRAVLARWYTGSPVWAVLALAWNIISGYGGLVSFGHAAFFGIGAYVVGLGFEQFGIPPSLGLILAGLAGAASLKTPCEYAT